MSSSNRQRLFLPTREWERTLAWSIFTSSVAIFPLALQVGLDVSEWRRLIITRQYAACFQHSRISSYDEWLGTAEFFGFVFGALAGCSVIPLDWNRPWQAFPTPNVISGLAGMALTVALGPWIFGKLRERAGYAPIPRGTPSRPIAPLHSRRPTCKHKQEAGSCFLRNDSAG